MRWLGYACLTLLLIVCSTACAGSRAGTPTGDELPGLPELPRPGELAPRSASDATALHGGEFETEGLEPRFVSAAGIYGLFEPPGGDTGFGYALYSFEISATSGPQALSYVWDSAPPEDHLWIAVSNWDQNAWTWFAANPEGEVAIDDIAPFRDELGTVLVVVLVGCTGAYNLDVLYFAEDPPVIAAVSPLQGTTGERLPFAVDVSGMEPISYDWDFGDGATPNTPDEADPTVRLTAPGEYNCSVTASNVFGEDTFEFDLLVEALYEPSTGELVAIPLDNEATVGESVTVRVLCGDFSEPFLYMNGVAVTVEEGAEYVDYTFDAGFPGGGPDSLDGIWANTGGVNLMYPEDFMFTEEPVIADPDLVYIAFNVIPIDGSQTMSGGELFSFDLQFTEAGTYSLGFLAFQGIKRTYYSDAASLEYNWEDISNAGVANTIVVSE